MAYKFFQAFIRHERRWTILAAVVVAVLLCLFCGLAIVLCCALAGHAPSHALVTAVLGKSASGSGIGLAGAIALIVACAIAGLATLGVVIQAILRHGNQRDLELEQMSLLLDEVDTRVTATTSELEDTSRRTMQLLNSTACAIIAVDAQGIVTFVNATGYALTGFSQEDLLGSHLHDILHPSDANEVMLPRDKCPLCQAIANATEMRFDHLRLCRGDGSTMPVSGSASPLREGEGVSGSVVFFNSATPPGQASA